MSDAILELKDLKKSYNQNKSNQIDVLLGANLLLKKGEVVALTAPSGAGKSTLLHIAGLLDQADTGDVLVAGQNLAESPRILLASPGSSGESGFDDSSRK